MAELFADSFDRGDSGDLGADWTVYTQPWSIVSNAAVPTSLASDSIEAYTGITWPDDQYAEVTLGTLVGTGTDIGFGVILRSTFPSTYYRFVVNMAATDNIEISRFDGHNFIAFRTATFTSGDVFRAEIEGTTIRVYKNGTQIGADMTDANIASGDAGLAYSSTMTSGSVLAFAGGDLTGATQAFRPDADTTTTGWTTTPLWSKIEEEVADGTVITATAS